MHQAQRNLYARHPARATQRANGTTRDHFRLDGWRNLATGLGMVGRDKRLSTQITTPADLTRQEIDALYRANPIAARIVDVPARDMLRAWFQISIATTDEGDFPITSTDAAAWVAGIQDVLDDLHARRELDRALRWASLYGGSIVVIGADDSAPSEQPIDLASLTSIKWLRTLTRYQATPGPRVTDLDSPLFGEPEYYTLTGFADDSTADPPKVHASRVLRFDGTDLPSDSRRGTWSTGGLWGDPVYLRVRDALRDFDGGYDAAATLLDNFTQTVWGLPGVGRMIAEGKEELIQRRAGTIDFVRSVVNAVIVDTEVGETFERKATPIEGLPELLDRNGIRLAASSSMPLTLLLGLAPKGFATEDKSGQENWDDIVSARQELELRPGLDHLIGLILASQAGPSSGRVPDTWHIDFAPLTQPTDIEIAGVRKTIAEADAIYLDREVVSVEEIAASRFGGDGYSIETQLDQAAREEYAAAEAVEQRERLAAAEAEVERLTAEREAQAIAGPTPPVETSGETGQDGPTE